MEVSEMEERKIGQIKEELKAATEAMLPSFIMAYESDERSGVIKLVEQAKKRLQKLDEKESGNCRNTNENMVSTPISVGLMKWEEDRLPVLLLPGQ